MPAMLTAKQWINSLRKKAWINVDSSQQLVDSVEMSLASLLPNARNEAKAILTPIPSLRAMQRFEVLPIHLLHALAKVTTPAVPNLAAFSGSWAERRYIWAFDPVRIGKQPRLRLSQYARRLDFHQKTLLSDNLGMAVASYVMEKYFKIDQIIDTTTAVEQKFKNASKVGKKWPDFVCVKNNGSRVYVVECKGSGSGLKETLRQLTQGTRQITAVQFPGVKTDRFVLATSLQVNGFLLQAIDPPDQVDSERERRVRKDSVTLDVPDVQNLSVARQLSYCGDFAAAVERLPVPIRKAYPAVNPPMLERETVNVGDVEAVGTTDRWQTPSGDVIEVFRGVDRRIRDPLVMHPEIRMPQYIDSHAYRLGSLGSADGDSPVVSVSRDGSILRIRAV
jgi:hypothetical protein